MIRCASCEEEVYGSAIVVDGKVFHNNPKCTMRYQASKRGLTHACPKCETRGVVTDLTRPKYGEVYDEEATAYAGMFAQKQYRQVLVGHETKICNVCNGAGYTLTEMKPITETITTVVGYK